MNLIIPPEVGQVALYYLIGVGAIVQFMGLLIIIIGMAKIMAKIVKE